METMERFFTIVLLLVIYNSSAYATEEIGLEILDTCLSGHKATPLTVYGTAYALVI